MPEHDSLNVHVGTLQEAEGLCPIRRIETHGVLCRERAGSLAFPRGMAITLPHRIDHPDAHRRSRNTEVDPRPPYQRRRFARESQRAPPVGDEPGRHTNPDDLRRPTEPRDAEGDARCRASRTERHDDRVGWCVELPTELEPREELADDRTRAGAPS